jgi:hypothetical protein
MLDENIYVHALKGQCHEVNKFLKEGLKNQISTLYIRRWFKKNFCLVMEKIEDKVLACFFENTY